MIEIKRRILPNRREKIRVTRVHLIGHELECRLEVSERLSSRQRRVMVNSFLRHMRPWLEHFHKGTILHGGKGIPNFTEEYARVDRWMKKHREDVPIQAQEVGIRLRIRRLELGYTQVELARRARVSRTQLSGIEKGAISPRADTLHRLRTALFLPDDGPEPNKAGH